MPMPGKSGIITSFILFDVKQLDNLFLKKKSQGVVNCSPGNGRDVFLQNLINLIGCWMCSLVNQIFEDFQAVERRTNALLAEKLADLIQTPGLLWLFC